VEESARADEEGIAALRTARRNSHTVDAKEAGGKEEN
jgi:hypothetical protein